jgi:hypothetical protein
VSKKNQELIIEYPDAFPISGALRAVFTERLRTFFKTCDTWSCSSEGSLPEKLLKMRKEMQESIGHPPSKTAAAIARVHAGLQPDRHESDIQVDSWGAVSATEKVVLPEELLSWEGLQARSMEDLPPIVRNAGLEMASRILGLQIRYGSAINSEAEGQPGFIPQALCPFTGPGAGIISDLTKTWSPADRDRLRHQIEKHVVGAACIAFILGMVLGAVLTPSGSKTTVITPADGYHAKAYAEERSYSAPPSQSALTAHPLMPNGVFRAGN